MNAVRLTLMQRLVLHNVHTGHPFNEGRFGGIQPRALRTAEVLRTKHRMLKFSDNPAHRGTLRRYALTDFGLAVVNREILNDHRRRALKFGPAKPAAGYVRNPSLTENVARHS